MPRIIDRINLNFESFFKLRKLKFRNNTAFCEQMGEKPYWVTDLKRGKAIITPQKAACMCILLQTTPEEILLHEGATEAETEKCQADIELVRGLVAQMRKEGEKEIAPGLQVENDFERRLRAAAAKLPPDFLEREIAYLEQKAQQLHTPTDSDM